MGAIKAFGRELAAEVVSPTLRQGRGYLRLRFKVKATYPREVP